MGCGAGTARPSDGGAGQGPKPQGEFLGSGEREARGQAGRRVEAVAPSPDPHFCHIPLGLQPCEHAEHLLLASARQRTEDWRPGRPVIRERRVSGRDRERHGEIEAEGHVQPRRQHFRRRFQRDVRAGANGRGRGCPGCEREADVTAGGRAVEHEAGPGHHRAGLRG